MLRSLRIHQYNSDLKQITTKQQSTSRTWSQRFEVVVQKPVVGVHSGGGVGHSHYELGLGLQGVQQLLGWYLVREEGAIG